MTTPFVYWLEHRPTGKHYIGRKTAKGCHPDDLLKTYFTSSEIVEPMAKANPEDFEILYIRTFDDKDKAIQVEEELLTWVDAENREEYFNRHNGGKNFRSRWDDPEYRKKCSKVRELWDDPEYREKITQQRNTPEYRQKRSQIAKMKWEDPEYRENSIEALKERSKRPEWLKKRSLAAKKQMENPQQRRILSESAKRQWEDPEFRLRYADSRKHVDHKGANNPKAKLDYSKAIEIRVRALRGEKGTDLAREFGVTSTTIYRIRDGLEWRED
jgi:hypothetical protein